MEGTLIRLSGERIVAHSKIRSGKGPTENKPVSRISSEGLDEVRRKFFPKGWFGVYIPIPGEIRKFDVIRSLAFSSRPEGMEIETGYASGMLGGRGEYRLGRLRDTRLNIAIEICYDVPRAALNVYVPKHENTVGEHEVRSRVNAFLSNFYARSMEEVRRMDLADIFRKKGDKK